MVTSTSSQLSGGTHPACPLSWLTAKFGQELPRTCLFPRRPVSPPSDTGARATDRGRRGPARRGSARRRRVPRPRRRSATSATCLSRRPVRRGRSRSRTRASRACMSAPAVTTRHRTRCTQAASPRRSRRAASRGALTEWDHQRCGHGGEHDRRKSRRPLGGGRHRQPRLEDQEVERLAHLLHTDPVQELVPGRRRESGRPTPRPSTVVAGSDGRGRESPRSPRRSPRRPPSPAHRAATSRLSSRSRCLTPQAADDPCGASFPRPDTDFMRRLALTPGDRAGWQRAARRLRTRFDEPVLIRDGPNRRTFSRLGQARFVRTTRLDSSRVGCARGCCPGARGGRCGDRAPGGGLERDRALRPRRVARRRDAPGSTDI